MKLKDHVNYFKKIILILLSLLLTPYLPTQDALAKGITKSYINKLISSPYSNWGINSKLYSYAKSKDKNITISLQKALEVFEQKSEVTVAVIDTGISFNHRHLNKNIFINKQTQATLSNFGFDFSNNSSAPGTQPMDYHGHGTHVSGIIKNIFPNVRIIPFKYFNEKATGMQNLVNSIKALEKAVDMGVDIINYSGGGPEADALNKARELRALRKAKKKGILIVAASGNDGQNIDEKEKRYFPASYKLSNILAVGSYSPNLKLLPSSNYGKETVHVIAPGYRINSAVKKINGKMSGTSQATAFVSGIAALLKASFPTLSYQEIKNIIIRSSEYKELFKGKVQAGKANAYLALLEAKKIMEQKNKRRIARYK